MSESRLVVDILKQIVSETETCGSDYGNQLVCDIAKSAIQPAEALYRRNAELESALGEQQHVICSWCGDKTYREGRTEEQLAEVVNAHVMACEKRPEAKILQVVYALAVSLGVDLETVSRDNPPAGLIDAFDAAWNRIRDERSHLESQITSLKSSILNQRGDDLCWLTGKETQIPPESEFLESCKRYHAQIANTAGVLNVGQMTIAQLEERVTTLEDEIKSVDEQYQSYINTIRLNIPEKYTKQPQLDLCMQRMKEAIAALEAENAELRKYKERLRDDLFHLGEWLTYKLNTAAKYVPDSDRSGHPHGWTAIQIPDWDVKQKLEAIDAAKKEQRNG